MRDPHAAFGTSIGPGRRGVLRAALRLTVVLVVAVALFSAGFLAVMATEGREYTWLSAVYWTLVTMSTLGFGDIVFASDLGRIYSLVVLLSGALLILVLLPFSFIQLVYLPWRAATRAAQTPRQLPDDVRDHVLLTDVGPVGHAVLTRAAAAGHEHAIVVDDVDAALRL
ncbi:MAG: potassium channel family protein, partial [Nitriliruptoraceae bacterium]